MKIRLKKLKDSDIALHPGHIVQGREMQGEMEDKYFTPPKVGMPFYISSNKHTSKVQEIISLTTFRTSNSIYEWEIIEYVDLNALQKLMDETAKWSQNTFNKGRFCPTRTASMAHHLSQEVKELIGAINVQHNIGTKESLQKMRMEFADCFMLLFNCATNEGFNIANIYDIVKEKLEINKQRIWGKPDKNGVVNHIKK